MSSIGQGLGAMVRLSVFLQSAEPFMAGAAQLTRPVLERFFAYLSEEPLMARTRGQVIGQVGTFLQGAGSAKTGGRRIGTIAAFYRSDLPGGR